MAAIEADFREIVALERDLNRMYGKAVPFANLQAINAGAFEGRKIWHGHMGRLLTLRNRYTERSVRVEKARGLNVGRQRAVLGSVADYMDEAEFGEVKRPEPGRRYLSIPTTVASGEGRGIKPRRKAVRAPSKLGRISLSRRKARGMTTKQRNFVAVKEAVEKREKFVRLTLDRGGREGVARITGGKRNPKVDVVHAMQRDPIRVRATPTLAPAVRDLTRRMPVIYVDALRDQVVRQRLFRERRR